MHRLPLLIAVTACGAAAPLAAQTFAQADSLLAVRDTSGAIAVYEAMVKRNLRNAEAHYRAGVLYLTRHVPGTELSPNRRKAEEHFRYATRFAGDSAKYWLGLADVFRSEDVVTTRVQVRGLVGRAREAADRAGAGPDIAHAAYRQARVAWERFEQYARRYVHSEAGGAVVLPANEAEWKDVDQYFRERVRPAATDADQYAGEAEEHLWTVLGHAPAHVDAAGLLAVVLGESGRWEEAVSVTRRLLRAARDSGRAWALHGLALARTERWTESQAAFDTAFARMTDAERAPYENLGQIMRAADRIRFAQMGNPERERLDSLYWRVAQPLALTAQNEVRVEFYARLAYADHRWSDPWRGYRGHETDMGAVYVRYGPPDIWAVFDRSSVVWIYAYPRFYFTFSLMPGFARAHYAGDTREAVRVASEASPARFDNLPLFRTLDTVLVQVARFRADGDSTAVAVFGAIPLRRMAGEAAVRDLPLTSGALVSDDAGRELTRDRRDETVAEIGARELQHRSWRLTLARGAYLLRVEAHLPTLDRGARAAQLLEVSRFPRTGLALSDLLVAARVSPRDSAATRWTEYFVEPSAGRFAPGEPVGLLWEIYNLTPDSGGVTRYDVEVRFTIEAIDRAGLFASVIGGIGDALGLTAVGDDRISLRYQHDVAATPEGARAEHLMVELKDAPAGRYGVEVVVRDRRTGAEAAAARTITVGSEPIHRQPPWARER